MAKKSTTAALPPGTLKEEVRLDPNKLTIITDPAHSLYQDRAKWDVDPGLVQSMRTEGFTSTVLVGEMYDYEPQGEQGDFLGYVVIAGRQRTKAAIEARLAEIPCLNIGDIAALTSSQLQALMIGENERRINNNTLERAVEAHRLYSTKLAESKPNNWPAEVPWKPTKEDKVAALEFTGQAFNLAPSRITNMFALLDEDKVSGGLRKAIKDEEISFKAALKMVKLTPIEQEEVLAKLSPVREAKAKQDKKGKGTLSEREVDAVVNPNTKIKVDREWLEKVKARRGTPSDVKEFIKELLNPGSTELPYLPGRLEKIKSNLTSSPAEDGEDE